MNYLNSGIKVNIRSSVSHDSSVNHDNLDHVFKHIDDVLRGPIHRINFSYLQIINSLNAGHNDWEGELLKTTEKKNKL